MSISIACILLFARISRWCRCYRFRLLLRRLRCCWRILLFSLSSSSGGGTSCCRILHLVLRFFYWYSDAWSGLFGFISAGSPQFCRSKISFKLAIYFQLKQCSLQFTQDFGFIFGWFFSFSHCSAFVKYEENVFERNCSNNSNLRRNNLQFAQKVFIYWKLWFSLIIFVDTSKLTVSDWNAIVPHRILNAIVDEPFSFSLICNGVHFFSLSFGEMSKAAVKSYELSFRRWRRRRRVFLLVGLAEWNRCEINERLFFPRFYWEHYIQIEMGVTGLWKLIEQSGKPVPLDTLENKVLAVGEWIAILADFFWVSNDRSSLIFPWNCRRYIDLVASGGERIPRFQWSHTAKCPFARFVPSTL